MGQFLDLPYELRLYIWKLSAAPRTVEIRLNRIKVGDGSDLGTETRKNHKGVINVTSPTPVPVALHVCRESRQILIAQEGRYEQAFSWGSRPRYIWVDFSNDMIDVGSTLVNNYLAEKTRIRRLKLTRALNESFAYFEFHDISDFENLNEVFLTVLDSTTNWATMGRHWPCGDKNVWITDSKTGQVINWVENNAQWMKTFKERGGEC